MRRIIPYSKEARQLSKQLRKKMTSPEKRLWEQIRKKALGVSFFRQFPILSYVVDFYAKDIGLAIEVDRKIHESQFLEDAYRQGAIERLGVRFIRFTNEDVQNNMKDVLNTIKEEIKNAQK